MKSGLKSLVDYDPEGDNDDDDDEADTTDEFDHKKQKINLTPEKPKAPAARPFWALGEAFSAPVIQPTAGMSYGRVLCTNLQNVAPVL